VEKDIRFPFRQKGPDLVLPPDIVFSLHTLAVRVERRVKTTLRRRHLSKDKPGKIIGKGLVKL